MPVRAAEPDDFEEICELLLAHAAYEGAGRVSLHRRETYEALFGEHSVARAHIAVPPDAAETVAGFALWYPTFSSWETRPGIWLEDLYVKPEHRRYGLGRELLATLRSLTSGRVEWDVAHGNDGAESFYQRLGAQPIRGWTRYRWSR